MSKPFCDRTNELKCRCLEGVSSAPKIYSIHALVRKLFSDHWFYLNAFAKASIFNMPDKDFLRVRVLDNANDLGNNFARFPKVGPQNGATIAALFTQHVQLGEVVIDAAKANTLAPSPENDRRLQQAIQNALLQGDQIAQFFHRLNPQISLEGFTRDFRIHNTQEVQMGDILLKGRFNEEARAFDEGYNHILGIADVLYLAFGKDLDK